MRTAPRTRTAVKAPSLISRDTVRGDTPRVAASWSIVSRGAMGVLCTYIGVYFALGVCAFHSRFISAFSARSARQSSLVRPVQSTAGPL